MAWFASELCLQLCLEIRRWERAGCVFVGIVVGIQGAREWDEEKRRGWMDGKGRGREKRTVKKM